MIFRQYEERLRRLDAKPNTLKNHRRTAVLFRESGLDPMTAEDWQIEEWLAGLPVAPRTKRLHLENLSAAYRYAVHRRLLPAAPTETVRLPRQPDQEPRILANGELRTLLGATITDQQWLMLNLLIYTGVRRTELRLLRWDDITPTSIKIRAEGAKGDKLRHIPVHPALGEALVSVSEPRSPYVLHGPRVMQPLSDGGLYARLQPFADIVDCTFHDFRRTVATSLAENGVTDSIIDKIMGWSARTVGQRYYIRRADATMQEAILRLYADDPLSLRSAKEALVHAGV